MLYVKKRIARGNKIRNLFKKSKEFDGKLEDSPVKHACI